MVVSVSYIFIPMLVNNSPSWCTMGQCGSYNYKFQEFGVISRRYPQLLGLNRFLSPLVDVVSVKIGDVSCRSTLLLAIEFNYRDHCHPYVTFLV